MGIVSLPGKLSIKTPAVNTIMIGQKKITANWEFMFLGPNIDAVATARQFGVEEEYAVNYHADTEGTQLNFQVVSEAVTSFRKGKKIECE